jgi:phosphohistidine phosphatase SixA
MRQATVMFKLRVALMAAALAMQSFGPAAFAADDEVWALLKKPGHVVLLRHSNAPGQVQESNDMDFKNCAIQRNLDADGRAQAGRIGDAFRKHGFTQVRLVSSLYCRALDTARLMKLGPVVPQPALNQVFLADIGGMRDAGSKGRALLKSVRGKPLTVLVSHVTNIQSIAGVMLDSGQMAVVHLDPAGEVVVDGKITVP